MKRLARKTRDRFAVLFYVVDHADAGSLQIAARHGRFMVNQRTRRLRLVGQRCKAASALERDDFSSSRHPEQSSWLELRKEINTRLEKARIEGLPEDEYNDLKTVLGSKDPRVIWQIADARTPIKGVELGKVLLNDTEWFGSFSLKDPAMMERFNSYVARPSTQ
jgi:hypothetical protein